MDAILQTLHQLEGVNGAMVADGRGQVLAFKAHAVYDADLVQQVSRAIVTAIDSVKLLHPDWESLTAQFSEGRLLIRNVAQPTKSRPPDLTLTVIADSRLNLSFAGVALRVAVGKLRNLVEQGLTTPALQPLPARAMPASPAAAIASPAASWPNIPAVAPASSESIATRMPAPDANANGLSWSGFGASSGLSASGITTVDAASSAALNACTKALARSVGPMAKRYVKEAVLRLCADRPFTREQTSALVTELEKVLEDPSDAARFRQAALKSA